MNPALLDLHALAERVGIRTAYRDMHGRLRVAGTEALLAVLRAAGVDIDRVDDAAEVRRALAPERPPIEPVIVAWGGRLAAPLRLPVAALGRAEVTLEAEDGSYRALGSRIAAAAGAARLHLTEPLPPGLLTLRVASPAGRWESFVISAPGRAAARPGRAWGVFAPLHAFGTGEHGVMSYRDLADAAARLGELGGEFIGVLPVLAGFLDRPCEPSPYAPASRLFWNDLFVDLGPDEPETAAAHRPALFDPVAAAARRKPRLQAAADAFFASGGAGEDAFRAFLAAQPHAGEYARFRAACDRFACGYAHWPERARSGLLDDDDVDAADVRRHLYGAWLADHQLAESAAAARTARAAALYIDLPLGVHEQGFDVWRWPALFVHGVSAGAPPDSLFRGGQNWGFRPLAPASLRRSRYDYLVRVLRHHMRHAGALRIDHVMSLVRLFWIPDGFPATEGVYVTYPRDELLALLVLESSRHDTLLIGEDLGTVPEEVRAAMRQRGLLRMFVLQFALGGTALPSVPAGVAASLNTHDTPPFAGFWNGLDIADQRDLGLLDDAGAGAAADARRRLRLRIAHVLGLSDPEDVAGALHGLLRHLAASDADLLLITLEDLWGETLPQNVPGTSHERPNWRRRARFDISQALADPDILRILRELDSLRSAEAPDARS